MHVTGENLLVDPFVSDYRFFFFVDRYTNQYIQCVYSLFASPSISIVILLQKKKKKKKKFRLKVTENGCLHKGAKRSLVIVKNSYQKF